MDEKIIIFIGGRGNTGGFVSQRRIMDTNEIIQRKSTMEEEDVQRETLATYENLISLTSKIQDAWCESFKNISEALQNASLEPPSLSISDISEPFHKEESINSLKKRLKYSKNPMERKQLQKELNSAYKARRI